ncbi:MAG: bifunctional UDP-sugar hydrolase/5'-nucleotidase [Pseudomonadota bacterium]
MTSNSSSITRREAIRAAAALGLVTLVSPRTLAAAGESREAVRVTLVLVNDLDRMADAKGRGGHSKLATVARAERARGNALLIHAGDAISPSILSGFDKGFHIVEILNRIAPDVFTPGNHEFDFGAETFRARLRQATFDVVAGNIDERDGSPVAGLKPTKMVAIGPLSIGLLGVTTEETAALSTPETIQFRPAVAVAKELAAKLRAEGADLVVAVSHIGFADDLELVRSGAVDVVLSGHDHNLVTFWNGKVALVESGAQADFVTPVDLMVEIKGGGDRRRVSFVPRFRPVDTLEVAADEEIGQLISGYESSLDGELSVVLGKTALPLDTRSILMRREETAFGNLVCDAMRVAVSADVCIMNGGGVRANRQYAAGAELTRRDVLEELPFGNRTVLLEVSGAVLRGAIEHGLAGDGAFPQVSGLRVHADMRRPAGQRLIGVEVGGKPLEEARTYKLATNDFVARGGDGYVMLKDARTLIDSLAGQYVAGHVMAYIGSAGTVAARVEGRLVIEQ